MQREIKFRVWVKDHWATGFSVDLCNGHFVSQNGFILQQFTGLKDKNNKDLYEGDIVKIDLNHITNVLRSPELPRYDKATITWLCSGFKVCQEKLGATWLGDFATCDCCPCGLEIIGNIFEYSNQNVIKNSKSSQCSQQYVVEHDEFGFPLGFNRRCTLCGQTWTAKPKIPEK